MFNKIHRGDLKDKMKTRKLRGKEGESYSILQYVKLVATAQEFGAIDQSADKISWNEAKWGGKKKKVNVCVCVCGAIST